MRDGAGRRGAVEVRAGQGRAGQLAGPAPFCGAGGSVAAAGPGSAASRISYWPRRRKTGLGEIVGGDASVCSSWPGRRRKNFLFWWLVVIWWGWGFFIYFFFLIFPHRIIPSYSSHYTLLDYYYIVLLVVIIINNNTI